MINVQDNADLTPKALCCKASDMVRQFSLQHAVKFEKILGEIDCPMMSYADYLSQLEVLVKNKTEQEAAKILRLFRLEQQVKLACKDILDLASVESMLLALSALAKACVEVAYRITYDLMAQRYGRPLDRKGNPMNLIILGMGKLGGGELNFSSDIDLILAFPEKGETEGLATKEGISKDKSIDNELFFHRVAQKLIKLLDQVDENGFVYRVDMRLKPFGSVGTLCTSFDSMRNYYLKHGRHWERYALIKMAPIAGDIKAGNRLVKSLSSFIYQHQLDYGVMGSIESMKSKVIEKENSLQDNLKLGEGGIREIEFIVQTFQMMYGGRLKAVRGQSLLSALKALVKKDLINKKFAQMLASHYLRLRKVENAIQYYRDQQEHSLPNKSEPRNALLVALREPNWLNFVDDINRLRQEVSQLFGRIFAMETTAKVEHNQLLDEDHWLEQIYQTDITREGAEIIAKDIVSFYQKIQNHDIGDKYLIRLNWVLPEVIKALDGEKNPVRIVKHMIALLEAIVDKSVYISLLVEHPTVLKKVMHLFIHNDWMAKFLCTHPKVIDELIHENHEEAAPSQREIYEELQSVISQTVDRDMLLEKLAHFKQAMMFRTASSDMQNKIRLIHVSDQLTWTAEEIIKLLLSISYKEMVEKYGEPTYQVAGQTCIAEFGIVAYGKLGGIEMGYHSDLDLVYLHSSSGENQVTNGVKSISNEVFFSRLIGKFNNAISSVTTSGKLYEVDVRLRPSGNSGLLVHSLTAFQNYQMKEAWTWEHQAIVRARFIAGGDAVNKGFTQIRYKVLTKNRDDSLRHDVLNMRQKLKDNAKSVEKGHIHVKHGSGGVTDIEFIVQYLILKYAKENHHLFRCSDNMRQIAALELFGFLRSADASELRAAYRAFRYWIHHRQLHGQRATAPKEQYFRQMNNVKNIWDKIFTQE